jgi:penicillin-binding protein 2
VTAPIAPDSSRLRLTVLLIVVGALFIALLARLWYLQVIDVGQAQQAITEADQVTVYQSASRGEILDREGQVLVANRSVPVIEVERADATDKALVTRLAAVIGMTVRQTRVAIDNNQFTYLESVPVLQDASPEQILYVQDHPLAFPGVTATTISEPHVTALGQYAGALLGYVGPIPSTELATYEKRGYQATDEVGIGGVEQEFEGELRGRPGKKISQINSSGQDLATVAQTAPVPGRNIRLSIDGALQRRAVLAMRQGEAAARKTYDKVTKRNFTAPGGSVVAEDPKTGQLLALATDPSYDPNLFNNGGISQANYDRLAPCATVPAKDIAAQNACALAHPADQLLNRPIQGEYAPGSTFKLTTATAGLTVGKPPIITPTSPFYDPGYVKIGSTEKHNDGDAAYGTIELPQAITVSSDDYFYNIGIQLWDGRSVYGQTAMQKVEESYGFGRTSGIDLPDESPGVVPTPARSAAEYKADPKAFPGGPGWYTGDSANTAVGQGEVLVTPLQLADAYAAFANGGTLHRPQVALDAETATGHVVRRYRPEVTGHSAALTGADRAAMTEGFVGVVNDSSGTAYSDFARTPLATKDIAGKTGTAQVTGAGKQDTSVFTSFAPASDPQYVIDCFIEDAGYGASVAAPVVRSLYEQLYGLPITPITYTQATGSQL